MILFKFEFFLATRIMGEEYGDISSFKIPKCIKCCILCQKGFVFLFDMKFLWTSIFYEKWGLFNNLKIHNIGAYPYFISETKWFSVPNQQFIMCLFFLFFGQTWLVQYHSSSYNFHLVLTISKDLLTYFFLLIVYF